MTNESQEQRIIIKSLTAIIMRMLDIGEGGITITTFPPPFNMATLEYETRALTDDNIKVLHDISTDHTEPGYPSISCCIHSAETEGKLRVNIDITFDEKDYEETNADSEDA
jgi:hypothetical protein